MGYTRVDLKTRILDLGQEWQVWGNPQPDYKRYDAIRQFWENFKEGE
jgi:hypothetical protein